AEQLVRGSDRVDALRGEAVGHAPERSHQISGKGALTGVRLVDVGGGRIVLDDEVLEGAVLDAGLIEDLDSGIRGGLARGRVVSGGRRGLELVDGSLHVFGAQTLGPARVLLV